MSKRVFVTVSDAVYPEPEEWAKTQGRYVRSHRLLLPRSNLMAFPVEAVLKTATEQGDLMPQTKPRSLRNEVR